ncbi:MAG TPA: hypothetical protein VHE59_11105 [Mucilaginibacter sp.]|nr:hypothetical protein [Mucilaginibacter sp.]
MKKLIYLSIVLCIILFLKPLATIGQTASLDSFVNLNTILKRKIKEDNYLNINYQKNGENFSNLSTLSRRVVDTEYQGEKCIKIVEIQSGTKAKNKAVSIVDRGTLRPVYYEASINDTLTQKARFDGETMIFSDSLAYKPVEKKIAISPSLFLSTTFSELMESVDFNRYSKVRFQTISPGRTPHEFFVERIKPVTASLLMGKINCWLLKFTVIDPNSKPVPAGYRYIDRESGQVIAFKTAPDALSYLSYERLMSL